MENKTRFGDRGCLGSRRLLRRLAIEVSDLEESLRWCEGFSGGTLDDSGRVGGRGGEVMGGWTVSADKESIALLSRLATDRSPESKYEGCKRSLDLLPSTAGVSPNSGR